MIDLTNKPERHAYMVAKLRMDIAYQVRLLRLQRGWTQDQLAEQCHTEQPASAQVENWNVAFPSLNTLRRIASAFDCGLRVGFEGWEDVINSIIPDFATDTTSDTKEGGE